MRTAALLSLLGLSSWPLACVTVHSQNRCPDSAIVRCITPVVCAIDRRRGCEVCRCSDVPYTPIQRKQP